MQVFIGGGERNAGAQQSVDVQERASCDFAGQRMTRPEAPRVGLSREKKASGHDADDAIRFVVEDDVAAKHVGGRRQIVAARWMR